MFRDLVVGLDTPIPLADGSTVPPINFDNAATTPPLVTVMEAIINTSFWYSSVHRGSGYKSQICSQFYEQSRRLVGRFVNADLIQNTVIYVKNTTEAINKVAHRLGQRFAGKDKGVVLTTAMEHHSNDLPWRKYFNVKYVEVDKHGRLRLDDLKAKLWRYRGRVRMVAVSGASNVTGYRNPIHTIARLAHTYSVPVLVDGAQLVPHVPVDVRPNGTLEHIDFLAFSAHKLYAPFGVGVLVGPKRFFARGAPDYAGGGTVKAVTHRTVHWAPAPHRDEAGTPNLIGVAALAAAIETLSAIGMQQIADHERQLTEYAIDRLKTIPGIQIYGDTERIADRLGIISFNLSNLSHQEVADRLAQWAGISVRNGCFCAHPYIHRLLRIPQRKLRKLALMPAEQRPGMVRISFGFYNTRTEIDVLADILHSLANA